MCGKKEEEGVKGRLRDNQGKHMSEREDFLMEAEKMFRVSYVVCLCVGVWSALAVHLNAAGRRAARVFMTTVGYCCFSRNPSPKSVLGRKMAHWPITWRPRGFQGTRTICERLPHFSCVVLVMMRLSAIQAVQGNSATLGGMHTFYFLGLITL